MTLLCANLATAFLLAMLVQRALWDCHDGMHYRLQHQGSRVHVYHCKQEAILTTAADSDIHTRVHMQPIQTVQSMHAEAWTMHAERHKGKKSQTPMYGNNESLPLLLQLIIVRVVLPFFCQNVPLLYAR